MHFHFPHHLPGWSAASAYFREKFSHHQKGPQTWDTQSQWKVNLAMLWLSQVLVMCGYCAAMPFIPLFIQDKFGLISDSARGPVVAAFTFAGSLGYAIFCPLWGWLSDRWGVKPMLFRGTFLTAIICPVMMICAAPWQLVFTRFVMASCAGTTAASQILVVKNTPDNHQGFALGVLSTAYWSGAMLGNVLGGLAVHYYGYNVAFILCGLTYAIAGIGIFFCHEQKSTLIDRKKTVQSEKTGSRWEAFTPSVNAVLLLFTLFSVVRNFEIPYLAMLVEDISGHDLAAKHTGVVSAFVALGAFLSGLVIGKLADKTKPLILLIPSLVCSTICLLLQAFTESIWVLGTARTMMYFIGGALMPVLEKLLSKITPALHRGAVFGVKSTASSMGVMFSTVASGIAINYVGVRGVFHGAAISTFLFIPLCIYMVWKVQKNNP